MKYHRLRGYKYQLAEDIAVRIPELPDARVTEEYFTLLDGMLSIRSGYCWDGASGPTIDTADTLTPSLAHDVLYQCIRERHLPALSRATADWILYRLLLARGMSWWRALYYFVGVRLGGWTAVRPRRTEPQDRIYLAP